MSRSRISWWPKSLTRALFAAVPVRPRRRSCRLSLEALEDRITPNNYLVTAYTDNSNSTAGSGAGNSGDLRYCLNKAIQDQQTDTITFASSLPGRTITLSSSLVTAPAGLINGYGQTAFIVSPSDNITIDGAAAPGLTIFGNGETRLFVVEAGGTLNLEYLTLSGGNAIGSPGANGINGGGGGGGAGLGGAVFVDNSTFTANGCTFVNNDATGGSGGKPGSNGSGHGGGGGDGGGLGGAPGAFGGGGNGALISAGGGGNSHGGGLGDFGGGGGGGPDNYSKFKGPAGRGGLGGFGGGGGGGGSSLGPDAASPSDYFGGAGGFGGGAGANGGRGYTAQANGETYIIPIHVGGGGGGAGLGGAVFTNGGTLTLTNDTFTQNTATGGAGGGTGAQSGQGDGGAVFMRNGTLTAIFDTFSSNIVTDGGTGSDIYVLSDKSDGGNDTSPGSGTATAAIVNSILGQNGTTTVSDFYATTNAGGAFPNLGGSRNDLISGPNNLIGRDMTYGSPSFAAAGLASNGGPTQTIALTATSTAALGKGATNTSITVDQRGAPRNTAAPDLGAFEGTPPQGITYTVTIGEDNSNSVGGTEGISPTTGDLRYCLNQALLDDGSAETIDFALPDDSTINLAAGLTTALPPVNPFGQTVNPYGPTAFVVGPSNNITIDGSGAPGLSINGNGNTRLFVVEGDGTLDLENLTLMGGNATGGAGSAGSGNGGGGGGGAGLGGAVLVDGGTFTATGCTFFNNDATGGPGGAGGGGSPGGGGAGGGLGGFVADGGSGSGSGFGFGGARGSISVGSGGGFGGGAGGGHGAVQGTGFSGGVGGFGGGGGGGGGGGRAIQRQ